MKLLFRGLVRPSILASLLATMIVALGVAAMAADPSGDTPPALDDLTQRQPTELGSTEGDDLRDWLIRHAPSIVRAGAETYASNCSVCHGDTGLGYEEAKLSFPADHRTCTRCHRPGNEREMSFAEMNGREHNLFDVGEPPPVRGEGALGAFPSDESLAGYLRATMPRYQPGRLSDDEYMALAVFLRWIQ